MKRHALIRELEKMGVFLLVMARNMIGIKIQTRVFLNQFLATEKSKIRWQSTFSRC